MTAHSGTLLPVAAVFVFIAGFVAYAWTASSAIGWLDSPEFVAASADVGNPHSPGHPIPVLVGKLGTLIPIGDMPLRVSLMSAAAGACAAVLLYAATRRVLETCAPTLTPRTRSYMAALLALMWALSHAALVASTRAEVYAIQALFVNAAIFLTARSAGSDGPAATRAAGLVAGLALATHHFIALTALVPLAIVVLARRPGVRVVTTTTILVVLGLAAFLQLPVRSTADPAVNWGAPHTAERLWWTVSAQAFQGSATEEHASSTSQDAAQAVFAISDQASWLLLIAALLGIYLVCRPRPDRSRPAIAIILALVGVIALGVAGRALLGFDPETPDHHAYLLPALAALIMLGGIGLASLAAALGALRPDLGRVISALVAIGLIAATARQMWRFPPGVVTGTASADVASWELDRLPPRTLLLPSYFQTGFRLQARRAIEGARPDIAILDRSFLTYPGEAERARRAYPALAGLIDAPLRADAPTPIAVLADIAKTRPVSIQLHINLGDDVAPWLMPEGPFARLVSEPPGPAVRARAEAMDQALRQDLLARFSTVARGDEQGIQATLLWHDYNRLRLFCQQNRLPAAERAFHHAWALAPGDATLRSLARACGLSAP